MNIKSTLTNRSGQTFDTVYTEGDPLKDLGDKKLQAVHAFCFCGDKMIIVYADKKGYWAPPGGGVEANETYEEAVVREVKEETNMKVLSQTFIGYIDIYEPERIVRQTRSFCIVEPYGPFSKDPDGDITEIRYIDPKDYKKYFDWGVVGDRLMERATAIKNSEFSGKLL